MTQCPGTLKPLTDLKPTPASSCSNYDTALPTSKQPNDSFFSFKCTKRFKKRENESSLNPMQWGSQDFSIEGRGLVGRGLSSAGRF